MRVIHDAAQEERNYSFVTRAHPWEEATSNSAHRYVNFIAHPELVEETLEDFAAHKQQPAVQELYELVRFINRPQGLLETNDSGARFLDQYAKSSRYHPPHAKNVSHARLMLLFRRWVLNTDDPITAALLGEAGKAIQCFDGPENVSVSLSFNPICFPDLKD